MTTKVLVAYGTTNGSTAQIAEAVAEVLCKEGLTAEALPAGSVDRVESYPPGRRGRRRPPRRPGRR
ncbi:hypothetical protein ACFVZZ_08605 [Streptomyces chartreusis]|uniref:hypothetical protein n=1 Tax=Streptomyces chartreusis TaxID=1969 RepID=UPI0036D97F61